MKAKAMVDIGIGAKIVGIDRGVIEGAGTLFCSKSTSSDGEGFAVLHAPFHYLEVGIIPKNCCCDCGAEAGPGPLPVNSITRLPRPLS